MPGINDTAIASKTAEIGEPTPVDDIRLIEGLKQRSDEAFRELIDRYEVRIYNTVLRVVNDAAHAEDVVQEVFLKTLRNIDSFNFQAGLYTWMYRVAVNAALDYRKKHLKAKAISLHANADNPMDLPADGEDPARGPERKEMAALVRKALDQLPEKFRTILILREFEGLAYEEIASVLKCSKGTVESRLFRARERLRQKMERYL